VNRGILGERGNLQKNLKTPALTNYVPRKEKKSVRKCSGGGGNLVLRKVPRKGVWPWLDSIKEGCNQRERKRGNQIEGWGGGRIGKEVRCEEEAGRSLGKIYFKANFKKERGGKRHSHQAEYGLVRGDTRKD